MCKDHEGLGFQNHPLMTFEDQRGVDYSHHTVDTKMPNLPLSFPLQQNLVTILVLLELCF